MKKITEYLGAALIAALPAIATVAQHCKPSSEPLLRPSASRDVMIWSYPGEYQARNFIDKRPFGSLDEVILRTIDGEKLILRQGDNGFDKEKKVYEQVYEQRVLPYAKR